MVDTEHYTENLRHVAEPASPAERREANRTALADYEALWLGEYLRVFAYYGEHTQPEQRDIALAYAEYVDKVVRERGEDSVVVYAHSDVAADTLMDAMYHGYGNVNDDFEMDLFESVTAKVVDLFDGPEDES